MKKKIYYAASIRGGRQDAFLYRRMIEKLKQHHQVLTEEAGNIFLCTDEQKHEYEAEIYQRGMDRLQESDLIIAECTNASIGVGYELCLGEQLKKEIHVFYDQSRSNLSVMILGNKHCKIHPYNGEKDLMSKLDDLLVAIG